MASVLIIDKKINKKRCIDNTLYFCILQLVYIVFMIGTILGFTYLLRLIYPITLSNQINNIIKHFLPLILVLKPVNLIFKALYEKLKIKHSEEYFKSDYKTGRIIGNLERLIVYIMLVFGEYTAIDFIFATKSITRFKDMDDKD